MATYGRDKKKHKLKSKGAIKPDKFFFRSAFVASRQLVVDKNFVLYGRARYITFDKLGEI
jgi:hypothetical protein